VKSCHRTLTLLPTRDAVVRREVRIPTPTFGGGEAPDQVFTAGNYADYRYDYIDQLQTVRGKESGRATNRLHEQLGYT
jgi:hypothetical protein